MLLVRTLLAILIPIFAALAGLPQAHAQAHAQGSTSSEQMSILEGLSLIHI